MGVYINDNNTEIGLLVKRNAIRLDTVTIVPEVEVYKFKAYYRQGQRVEVKKMRTSNNNEKGRRDKDKQKLIDKYKDIFGGIG